jgi:hypothetical protein
MLQWNKFDSIVQQGREHAVQVLGEMPAEALRPYRSTAA